MEIFIYSVANDVPQDNIIYLSGWEGLQKSVEKITGIIPRKDIFRARLNRMKFKKFINALSQLVLLKIETNDLTEDCNYIFDAIGRLHVHFMTMSPKDYVIYEASFEEGEQE